MGIASLKEAKCGSLNLAYMIPDKQGRPEGIGGRP